MWFINYPRGDLRNGGVTCTVAFYPESDMSELYTELQFTVAEIIWILVNLEMVWGAIDKVHR
jgi:hypothetical protein